ncbi:MAG: hypothetical protein WCR04_11235 [Fibrobacteraceae bacterium]
MLITKFIEQLNLSEVWPKKPYLYIQFLKNVPGKRRSIKQLSIDSGVKAFYGYKIVENLENAGYVRRVFGGQTHYIILTKEGEDFVRGLGK